MILWWACLTLVLRMVILRTTRGQDRKRRFGSFCSWISTMVWRTAALSVEGGNRRLVQDLAADDVDRAHVGVPVGVGAEFVGRFGDEHLCRVVGDQQSRRSPVSPGAGSGTGVSDACSSGGCWSHRRPTRVATAAGTAP